MRILMRREVTVGHMLFTVSVKDGLATWSVRPSEAVENKHTKVLFSGLVTEEMGDELLKLSWVIRLAEDEARGKINE
tara:strand:- start:300 stop:530 length:231 start_codon:yes stop_codon:yes gene_type:complete